MQAGISTACLYPATTEESFGALAAFGPSCVEVFLNTLCELAPGYLRDLRKLADDNGISVASVHPYYSGMEPMFFFSRYERRFFEGMEIYRRFYEAASILGAQTLVFHGDYKDSALERDAYFERFGRLWEDARRHGIALCQENVERCKSGDVEFLAAMVKELPHIRYVLDVKQAVRAGQDVLQMAKVLGEKIQNVHLSDHDSTRECLLPGKGTFNIRGFLSAIASTGFDGAVILEVYGESFNNNVELSAGYQHISTIISTH